MNSENLILRETTHSPLVNKNDFLTGVDHDNNLINIYEDLLALCLTNGVIAYDISTTYDDSVFNYVTHEGKLWKYVNAVPGYNVTPGTNEAYWIEVFPTELAHRKNSDTILDEGGLNEVSASEIRAFIDAGLTSTTNLSLSEQTDVSLKINSSTGTDVTLLGATETTAGLLNSEDKQKLNQISGINTGDQTLESLGAEATANKVIDFSVIDNITFPTTEAVANKITSDVVALVDAELTNYATTVQLATKENTITAGITGQYWRGDKSWQTLDKTAVGLGNVPNTDATNASNLASGTVPTARLGSGTADSTTYLRGDNTWATIPAGGLTYFTEAQNSSTPNATVKVDSLTAVASTTDADFVLSPKGAGALLALTPDNTTTGGNKRGQFAVDWQLSVGFASDRVASGNYATIIGGQENKSSGTYTISGGYSNQAIGNYSVSFGSSNSNNGTYSFTVGFSNIANGNYSIVLGRSNSSSYADSVALGYGNVITNAQNVAIGYSNTASGTLPCVALGYQNTSSGGASFTAGRSNTVNGLYGVGIGYSNTASQEGSICIGYTSTSTAICSVSIGQSSNATANDSVSLGRACNSSGVSAVSIGKSNTSNGKGSVVLGSFGNAYGISGKFSFGSFSTSNLTIGDSQSGLITLTALTTDATTTTMVTDWATSTTPSTINQLILQDAQVISFEGKIQGKQTSSTNVGVWKIDGVIVRGSGVGTTTLVISNVTLVTNASGWGTPTLTADTTNGGLKVQVAGLVATNIKWSCRIDTVETLY